MFCTKCGQQLQEQFSYCPHCGSKNSATGTSAQPPRKDAPRKEYVTHQVSRTIDIPYHRLGMKAKVETLENDINAVIAEYPNIKFVDLKFNVERGEPRQALLSIDVIENDTVPYRFKVKHFLGRGRTAKFWFGSPPKDNFDAMLNGFTDAHPKIKVRQTRHITNLGVVTDMFIVYSELKS